jgi:DNA-binding GntR family transcriptional regulator
VTIDKRSREPSYMQLAALLRSQIADGTYQADDQITPVGQLAEQFGLNPRTVRQALRVLESEGLVAIVPGRGTYVR